MMVLGLNGVNVVQHVELELNNVIIKYLFQHNMGAMLVQKMTVKQKIEVALT